ncbi:MAG: hypothetical protein WCQ57_15150 [Verrucomicrobiota bacterium]
MIFIKFMGGSSKMQSAKSSSPWITCVPTTASLGRSARQRNRIGFSDILQPETQPRLKVGVGKEAIPRTRSDLKSNLKHHLRMLSLPPACRLLLRSKGNPLSGGGMKNITTFTCLVNIRGKK